MHDIKKNVNLTSGRRRVCRCFPLNDVLYKKKKSIVRLPNIRIFAVATNAIVAFATRDWSEGEKREHALHGVSVLSAPLALQT